MKKIIIFSIASLVIFSGALVFFLYDQLRYPNVKTPEEVVAFYFDQISKKHYRKASTVLVEELRIYPDYYAKYNIINCKTEYLSEKRAKVGIELEIVESKFEDMLAGIQCYSFELLKDEKDRWYIYYCNFGPAST